jgi:hypothetical protein
MESWRIWVAIVLLLDAGVGLWNARRLARVIPPRRLAWIAALEGAVAAALVLWHVLARP